MKTSSTWWRCVIPAASAIVLLALLPQALFLFDRGREWQGANPVMHPDEVAYSAYLASLIRARPQRNDPYSGRVDSPESPVAESLFSIQIVPAFVLAAVARLLGLNASLVFLVFPLVCGAASALALFWFISFLTGDKWLAAASVWIIPGFGTLMAAQGIMRHIPNLPYLIPQWISYSVQPVSLYHLPFLRFYQPAFAFSLFFLMCGFVWRALTTSSGRKAAAAAIMTGLTFALLIFSYFFLWTAAGAFLACLFIVWIIGRNKERTRTLMVFSLVAGIVLPALIFYFRMLSHRAATVDSTQALIATRHPDLFRLSEIAAGIMLVLLFVGARRKLYSWRDGLVLFTSSLALSVIVVFNQQVLTGRSLQPIHYEWFIANYCALTAIVLTVSLWSRGLSRPLLTRKRLLIVAIVALLWGAGEVWLAASLNLTYNRSIDRAVPVGRWLTALYEREVQTRENGATIPVVLMSDLQLSDRLPTDAPQAVLWAPRMLVFPGVTEIENRQRFFQQLYYLGFDEEKLNAELDTRDWNFYAGMFSYDRLSPAVSGSTRPISPAEIQAQVRNYLSYVATFTHEQATSPTLSYIVVAADKQPNFANLDRWYVRDAGERIESFVIYRVSLR